MNITELAKEAKLRQEKRIELESVSQLTNISNSVKGEIKNFDKVSEEVETVRRRIKVNANQAQQTIKQLAKVLDGFAAKAKDIGINPRDVAEFKEASKKFSELNTVVSAYTKLRSI